MEEKERKLEKKIRKEAEPKEKMGGRGRRKVVNEKRRQGEKRSQKRRWGRGEQKRRKEEEPKEKMGGEMGGKREEMRKEDKE